MSLRVSLHGPRLGGESELDEEAKAFARNRYVKIPKVFDLELLHWVWRATECGAFSEVTQKGIGSEARLEEGDVLETLRFLLNAPLVHHWAARVTGNPVRRFDGRVFQMRAGEHSDSWHDDVGFHRVAALSINIGRRPFEGGVLQLRKRNDGTVVEIPNPTPGDGILFSIDPGLEHQVSPLNQDARTVVAGWFQTEPAFWGEHYPPLEGGP